ncbi:Methyl-accepting chemotaxis protein IV [compost metagenome]
MRTLAQRSSSAAKDISHLIRENVEKSEHGAKIAGSSGAVLKEILVAVKKVADLNSEIAAGSKEQASGLEQISKAMNQLDQATQGNAASSEEVAASSSQVAQQGTALSTLVVELDHLVNGKSAA